MSNVPDFRRIELLTKTALSIICSCFVFFFSAVTTFSLKEKDFLIMALAVFCLMGFIEMSVQLVRELNSSGKDRWPRSHLGFHRFNTYHLIVLNLAAKVALFCYLGWCFFTALENQWYHASIYLLGSIAMGMYATKLQRLE